MKNNLFLLDINKATGGISCIQHPADPHKMNWCAPEEEWGRIWYREYLYGKTTPEFAIDQAGYGYFPDERIDLVSCTAEENRCVAEYANQKISVTVLREFTAEGNLAERYCIRNLTSTVFCLNRENFGIALPFHDRYTSADECMVRHCHTHLWCGHHVAWVNALRMGVSDCNLGLVLTEGALDCYSQIGCHTNVRGVFVVHPESVLLKRGETYTLRWELFWHKGTEDFRSILRQYPHNLEISAPHFTVFRNESLAFSVRSANGKPAEIFLGDQPLPTTFANGTTQVCIPSPPPGEHRFRIRQGATVTWADFLVKEEFQTLLEKRVRFLVRNQQCRDPESPLYGAFLIYDNDSESPYFDDFIHDHNATRERLNIPLLLLKYLQQTDDPEVRAAMELYADFVFREFFDEETGEVFNSIGKNRSQIRPYNTPGVMLLLSELYFVTKEKRHLYSILKLAERYYSIGGEKCYSNAVAVKKVMRAFQTAEMHEEAAQMLVFFRKHAENIIRNGTDYPKHEVNYEQTIVTPAVSIVAECGLVTGEARYTEEAAKHMACLERFSGFQPSFHLNEIAIRFWDAYWFGKSMQFGDTLPHHLSVLTARAYANYAALTGDPTWIHKAEECIRNCLCLIRDDGRGAAAYVYPYKTNGKRGEFYDSFANDQDLVLYDALYLSELVEAFKLRNKSQP